MNHFSKVGRVVIVSILILAMLVPLFGCSDSSTTIQNGEEVSPSAPIEEQNQVEQNTQDIEESTAPDNQSPTPDQTPEVENEEPDDSESDFAMEESDDLSSTQRNSINMLNYMTVLAQEINEEQGDQLFLESAYSSLVNDIYPNAVDLQTQAQITKLMNTINNYRMIAVKRARLEYIYEQNRAQALRKAIPNPIGILSAVQSGSMLKAAAAVLYMAIDSASSYQSATSQADLQFLKDGWELDDAASAELHSSTVDALTYMLNMVRNYDLPGDYALNQESVKNFVLWSGKPDSQLVSKIAWMESHQSTYQRFGPYWLELAREYYDAGDYGNSLAAVREYESVTTRIFRKDVDYAGVLPQAIVSAKETLGTQEYIEIAGQYCSRILDNTKDSDWGLRYFAAQTYMDLYALSEDMSYLEAAYKIAFDNVNVLVDEQRSLNSAYLSDLEEIKVEKDASKREKTETRKYNKLLKEERKIALPPVNEALYLNCDLLFALVERLQKPADEQKRIEAILHENGDNLFLPVLLDNRFWFPERSAGLNSDNLDVSFDGQNLSIPAAYLTDRSVISAEITGANGEKSLDDWKVVKVKRNSSGDVSAFETVLISQTGANYSYKAGDVVKITVTPVADSPEEYFEFEYHAVSAKKLIVFNGIEFERVVE